MGFLPVLVFVLVLVPLLLLAFRGTRRSKLHGERPTPEDAAVQQRIEDEFAEAEAYQEEWRAQERQQHRSDTRL